MKTASYVPLLLAASVAAVPSNQQKPLGDYLPKPERFLDQLKKPLDSSKAAFDELKQTLKGLSAETQQIWEEVSAMYPDDFNPANLFSQPKPHKKRPDHEWDYIKKGDDLQNMFVTNEQGNKERAIDGHLSQYGLRTKKVDPKSLGVDKVKQYSGYLDDEETDKHLFYCKLYITAPKSSV